MSKAEPKEDDQVVYVVVNNLTSGTKYHYDDQCRGINKGATLRDSTEKQERVWRDGCKWCTEE